jgi:cytidine deaminase
MGNILHSNKTSNMSMFESDMYVRHHNVENYKLNGINIATSKHVSCIKVGKTTFFGENYCEANCSVHAELSVLLKIKNPQSVRKLYVSRLGPNESLKMSKPCSSCINILKDLTNIKYIYYSINTNMWDKVRLNYEESEKLEDKFWYKSKHKLSKKLNRKNIKRQRT